MAIGYVHEGVGAARGGDVASERWADAERDVADVPLYQQAFAQCSEPFEFAQLESFPLLTRDRLAGSFPHGWMRPRLADAIDSRAVEYATTSGSSGNRVHVVRPSGWWINEHQRAFPLVDELSGFAVGRDPKTVLTTLDCSAPRCRITESTPEDRMVANALFVNTTSSPTSWTRTDVVRMLDEAGAHRAILLDADPAYLALLLAACERYEIDPAALRPSVLSLDFELTTAFARRYISEFIDVPTVDLYGTTELGCLLSSSDGEARRLSDLSHIEFEPVFPERRVHELVVTSVKNPLMPFVRYRFGDLVQLAWDGSGTAPHDAPIERVLGRRSSTVRGRDGTEWTAAEVDVAISVVDAPIVIYQLVEHCADAFALHVVVRPGRALRSDQRRALAGAVVGLLGHGVEVDVVEVPELQPGSSGKFDTLRRLGGS